jgi:hypothetical protein
LKAGPEVSQALFMPVWAENGGVRKFGARQSGTLMITLISFMGPAVLWVVADLELSRCALRSGPSR